jgi:hypothetical protein
MLREFQLLCKIEEKKHQINIADVLFLKGIGCFANALLCYALDGRKIQLFQIERMWGGKISEVHKKYSTMSNKEKVQMSDKDKV